MNDILKKIFSVHIIKFSILRTGTFYSDNDSRIDCYFSFNFDETSKGIDNIYDNYFQELRRLRDKCDRYFNKKSD